MPVTCAPSAYTNGNSPQPRSTLDMAGYIPVETDFSMGADPQLQSTFFGRLPREIRELVYAEFWAVSGTRQHVFERRWSPSEEEADGSSRVRRTITHFPCVLAPGPDSEKDTRNRDFERVWREQQARHPQIRDERWARRMASKWHEHWRCEEAMIESLATGKKPGTLFLPALLACKKILRYGQLHGHIPGKASRQSGSTSSSPSSSKSLPWPALLTSLSHLAERASLQSVILRLDVADKDDEVDGDEEYYSYYLSRNRKDPNDNNNSNHAAATARVKTTHRHSSPAAPAQAGALLDLAPGVEPDRFWWEVRETRALGWASAALRRRMRLFLPELTADVARMRVCQFAAPSPEEKEAEDMAGAQSPSPRGGSSSSSSRSDTNTGNNSSSGRVDNGAGAAAGRVPSDFRELVRYPRRRWKREEGRRGTDGPGAVDGVQARLEFFSPREHVGSDVGDDDDNNKMRSLFWGMLIS